VLALPFKVTRFWRAQHPLERPPWRADRGSWTFVEGSIDRARFLIGYDPVPAAQPGLPGYASAAARWVWLDAASARDGLAALADYLQQMPFGRKLQSPTRGPIALRLGVLTEHASREKDGAFASAPAASWVCTKLTFQDDEGGEIYFNFNPHDRLGEFSEKEPAHRAAVLHALTISDPVKE
jgi:hypothetical protein